jgi:hypothetical protein
MSSVVDPIEEGLKQLSSWTDDDPCAASAVRRVFFEEACWRYIRRFYDRTPKAFSSTAGESKTAGEQVELLLARFVDGAPLVIDKDINWFRSASLPYVWELRTIDVRLFGVFVKPDCLIVCAAGLADLLHDPANLANTHTKAVNRVINIVTSKLPPALRNPIQGSDPHAVLSKAR